MVSHSSLIIIQIRSVHFQHNLNIIRRSGGLERGAFVVSLNPVITNMRVKLFQAHRNQQSTCSYNASSS